MATHEIASLQAQIVARASDSQVAGSTLIN